MIVKNQIALLLIVTTLFSCRYSFDKKDLSILDTYNIGDTIIFQSDNGFYDSIVIIDKQLKYNGISEGYSGNPQTCDITYKTIPPSKPELVGFGGSQDDVYSNEKYLLSAVRWEKDKQATVDIKYGGFSGKIPNEEKLIDDSRFGKHYDMIHFCIDCIGVDSTEVIRIKWKPGIGIVWYQRKDSSNYKLVRRY
ncbi:MAG: hypothetical protein RL596_1578 [Bacteroidota bacterium]|jgi:hypothetical protein